VLLLLNIELILAIEFPNLLFVLFAYGFDLLKMNGVEVLVIQNEGLSFGFAFLLQEMNLLLTLGPYFFAILLELLL
jgi:hypothetical protein